MQMPFRKRKLRPQLIFMHFFLRLLCSNQSIHKANVGRREKKEKRKRAFVGRKLSVDKYVNARCRCETSPLPSKHFGPTLDANT